MATATEIAGFPYREVEFTKDGRVHSAAQADDAVKLVRDRAVTDVFVLSHGWNNDMGEARALYVRLLTELRGALPKVPALAGRRFAAVGVLWPSKKFADKALKPSGSAGVGGPITDEELRAQIDVLAQLLDDPRASADLRRARELVSQLEDKQSARLEFTRLLLAHAPAAPAREEDDPDLTGERGDLVKRLGTPAPPAATPPPRGRGGAARVDASRLQPVTGGAAGLGDLWNGIKGGAQQLLNFVTYYTMKDRAGVVGRDGVAPLLARMTEARPDLRIHLIGHSFGGRVVTAAAAGPAGPSTVRPSTLTLLQAAFSHYGLSNNYGTGKPGFFRRVTDGRVRGPILITCTHNDKAVGLAYAIASRAANQIAAGVGGAGDPFGGIGANGALLTPEAEEIPMGDGNGTYSFAAGRIYNLRADRFIKDHSDIAKPQVAYAILRAVEAAA